MTLLTEQLNQRITELTAEVTKLRAIIEEAKGLLTPIAFELDNGYTSKKALFAGQIMDLLAKATPEGGTK